MWWMLRIGRIHRSDNGVIAGIMERGGEEFFQFRSKIWSWIK
jgi:hypothetical protein